MLTTVGSWPTAPASVVGNVIYVNDFFNNTLLNQNAVRIRSNLNQKYIIDIAQGTANQASIIQEDIKTFLLPILSIEEQSSIVAKVDEIMEYLNELEKIILAKDII